MRENEDSASMCVFVLVCMHMFVTAVINVANLRSPRCLCELVILHLNGLVLAKRAVPRKRCECVQLCVTQQF